MPTRVDPRVSHTAGLLVALAGVGASWQAVCAPSLRGLASTRAELAASAEAVEQTEAMLRDAGGGDAWLAAQQQVLQHLEPRVTPRHETPALLDRLLRRVDESHLAVLDVSQGNLEPAADAQGRQIALGAAPCLMLPVTLTVEGGFHDAVAFLDRITGPGFPGLVAVRRVSMRRKERGGGALTSSFHLALYVVGP